jgi:hypothetical protein
MRVGHVTHKSRDISNFNTESMSLIKFTFARAYPYPINKYEPQKVKAAYTAPKKR